MAIVTFTTDSPTLVDGWPRGRRRRVLHVGGLATALIAAWAGACGDGHGTGEARGPLYIKDCNGNQDFGGAEEPKEFDLQPRFLAGEPTEDISPGERDNRLVIRLQRSKKRIEYNDVLAFDVAKTYAVARCVRGRILPNGMPDYDAKNCVQVPGEAGAPPRQRARVGVNQPIRANLMPRITCQKNIIGTAVSAEDKADGTWESWIEFEEFGRARQDDRPADKRDPVPFDFKIDFGERVHASQFQVTLTDDRVVKAARLMTGFTESELRGSLKGSFDFDLERGQAAQTFP